MTKDNGVEEIRALIDRRSAAVRARDAEKSAAQSGPDVLAFDVVDPLQYRGREVVKKRAQEWFSSFDGAIEFEMRDVTIAASGDVGFSHSLNRVSGTTRRQQIGDVVALDSLLSQGGWTVVGDA